MNAPRVGWTTAQHLRVLLRLLDDLIRQARDLRASYFTPEVLAAHRTSPQALEDLRRAFDALHDTADRVNDAVFNYRRQAAADRKRRTP